MKQAIMVALIYVNLLAWQDAQAVDRDWLGIPVDNRLIEYSTTALFVADWLQTLQIHDTDGVYEKNLKLGSDQPSHSQVNQFFILKMILHAGINYLPISAKAKNIWNILQSGMTLVSVLGNYKLGLEVKF